MVAFDYAAYRYFHLLRHLKHQQSSGTSEVWKQQFCDNPVEMQGIIKTREKRVQSNYPGQVTRP